MLFKLITTIIAVTMAVLAAPSSNPRGRIDGMAIPLTKHSSLPYSNKSVNIDALKSQAASHSAKIIRGMRQFERNTGTQHPSAVNLAQSSQSSGAGVNLKNWHDGEMWYGSLLIGTPAKIFTVQLDTGSSDILVPASTGDQNCRSHHNLWDPTLSTTSEALYQEFEIDFVTGAIATGEQYTDNVTIAGFTADIQTIGAATTYSSEMAVSVFSPDGILGLALPSLSEYHDQSPLLHTLFNEEKLPQSMFSLKLATSEGELYIGGMNKALYIDSSLAFTPITSSGFWQLKIDNIKVHDKIVLTDVPAIIDTGANFIFGDPSRVLALHEAYGGKALEKGYYTFPCSSFPSVIFTIGGKPFLIPANVLKLGPVESGSRDCFTGIVAHDTGHLNSWTVGIIFLQLFYTVFDFGSEPPRVGFATLAS